MWQPNTFPNKTQATSVNIFFVHFLNICHYYSKTQYAQALPLQKRIQQHSILLKHKWMRITCSYPFNYSFFWIHSGINCLHAYRIVCICEAFVWAGKIIFRLWPILRNNSFTSLKKMAWRVAFWSPDIPCSHKILHSTTKVHLTYHFCTSQWHN